MLKANGFKLKFNVILMLCLETIMGNLTLKILDSHNNKAVFNNHSTNNQIKEVSHNKAVFNNHSTNNKIKDSHNKAVFNNHSTNNKIKDFNKITKEDFNNKSFD